MATEASIVQSAGLPVPLMDRRVPDLRLERSAELPPDPLRQTSVNIIRALGIAREGGAEASRARTLLTDLLVAREDYYFAVASSINPGIQRVGNFLYRYGAGERPIFGSVVSLLDADQGVVRHFPIADALRTEMPGRISTLTGEETSPEHRISSSVVVSGSSAESRTHPFAADLDLTEFLQFKAHSAEHAGAILARGIQNTGAYPSRTITVDGTQIHAQIDVIRVGRYGENASTEDKKNRTISWTLEEIQHGYKDAIDINGQIYRINLAEVCQNPDRLRFEYLMVTPSGVYGAEKTVVVQVQDQSGKTLIDNSESYVYAFDQVYFEDPQAFGLMAQVVSPDKYMDYISTMIHRMNIALDPSNKRPYSYSKRLYGVLKAIGDLRTVRQMSPFFQTDSSRLNQLIERIRPTQKAIKERLIDPSAITSLEKQLLDILRKPEILAILPEKDRRAISEEKIKFQKLKKIAYSAMGAKSIEMLKELQEYLDPALMGILPPMPNLD